LEHMSKTEREDYEKFWDAFGEVLKEGIATDLDPEGRIAKLLLFASTNGDGRTTLAEAVERMPEGQEDLWIASGASRAALEGSPHLELFRERGYEVLFATDPIDEWVLERLTEFDGKKIRRVSQGTSDLENDDDKSAREAAQEEHEGLLESLKTLLDEHVEEVRLTKHLSDSPAVLVAGKGGPTSQMQRIMERAGQPVPKAKYVLELNPDHALFERLTAAYGEDTQSPKVGQYAELLLGQALLFEGAELPDPARFAKCMNELLAP
ncbi:MAG: molecular chaperone HtpG, partial [Planctomycetota bacterium]